MGNKQSSEPAPLSAAEHGFVVGDRVQTQWTEEEGGNDQWYPGTIVKIRKDGQCKIEYDDGDKWTGDARYIMRLTGSAPTISTIVQAVPDGPVLVAAPSIPQATVVPAQAVAVDASVVAK